MFQNSNESTIINDIRTMKEGRNLYIESLIVMPTLYPMLNFKASYPGRPRVQLSDFECMAITTRMRTDGAPKVLLLASVRSPWCPGAGGRKCLKRMCRELS